MSKFKSEGGGYGKRRAKSSMSLSRIFGFGRGRSSVGRGSRMALYIILAVALLVALVAYYGEAYSTEKREGHTGLARHWHAKLGIVINGEKYLIPEKIGVNVSRFFESGRRGGSTVITGLEAGPLHTHADDGVIHIELHTLHDYNLGDFFKVWGKTFNGRCLLDYCNDSTHVVRMFVNGKPNQEFDQLLLKDGQDIEIRYETR